MSWGTLIRILLFILFFTSSYAHGSDLCDRPTKHVKKPFIKK